VATIGRRLIAAAAVAASAIGVGPSARASQEGWVIERAAIELTLQRDGSIAALEAFDVDFRDLPGKHGLLRELVVRQRYDAEYNRRYAIDLDGVTDADGAAHRVQTLTEGANLVFRIGDPDRTVTGRQTYRIAYGLDGALNGFPDHDELYWNATGTWPVPVERVTVTVRSPGGGITRVECFVGARGATNRCDSRFTPDEAVFSAVGLGAGEQLTIVTGLEKGVVTVPAPLLVSRPRPITRFFDRTPGLVLLASAAMVWVGAGVWSLWWWLGRDRRFVSLHRNGPPQGGRAIRHSRHGESIEEQVPLFGARPIAVEFEPPEGIRPGQVGVLVDERADTLDVTATIVDLASRGYLTIAEIPKTWWFGSADWQLDRLGRDENELLAYERVVLGGLFGARDTVKVSELKNKFYTHLARAKEALYQDAVARGWFWRHPTTVRTVFRVLGLFVMVGGLVLTGVLGSRYGYGLLGLPIAAGGLLLTLTARAMPRRTALGRRLMRRSLGFRKYIETGERHTQAFAERANIFTAYLPYAVAFRCVEKWAEAFSDIDLQAATEGWYSGSRPFNPSSFSSAVSGFSSSVSSTMTSTPGGSGGSGFSGGSSGGGGGGGGGGSW
jgi:uncharacterized protein (TIGR04222 family)